MTPEPIHRPERFDSCYGCGAANPRGLHMVFSREGDEVVSVVVPAPEHGGYGRVLHGGVTSTLIDEAFGWAIYGLHGKLGMTTELAVEFSAPVFCGQRAVVRGKVLRHDDRDADVVATVEDAEGKLLARGRGKLRLVSLRAVERLGRFTTGGGG